jgi:hypothetical protein
MAFPEAYISKIKEENFVDGGNVQLEWNDTVNTPLDVGTVCPIDSDYILFSKYYPNQVSAYEYRYTPRFLHKLAQTNYLPFYFKTRAVGEQSEIILATYPYTGNIYTVANALAKCLTDHGDLGQWTADTSGLSDSIIKSVNFDGATIKSAAAAIADAFGVDYYFIWSTHTIKFGSYAAASSPDFGTNQTAENGTENIGSLVSATDGGIQYNVFRILGGTKNMSKKTISGQNVQVTQRLGGNIIDTRPAGSTLPKIMKDLVFDDIYPKMELWMYDVHERRCYLQDENGKKIIDTTFLNPETGEEEHTYKQYSKWYFKLARWNGSELVPYIFDTNLQIQNMPLAMLFQPNYDDNALPQPLVGREYELVYFSSANPELELDDFDVNPSGYQPIHGEFRIIFKVEGNMILPSTYESGIRPYGGSMSLANNKVTLINVEVDSAYEATAKAELQEAANAAIAIETRDKSSQTYVTYGEGPQLGGIAGSGGTVTNIRKDLISGEVQYTVGDYNSSKGLISRLSDKIETISTSGSGTTKQDDPTSGRDGGISELAIPILARMMGSGNVVKDTLTILKELILGTNGQGIFIDHNGDSNATIGSLTVLGATHLNEIDVNHIRHTGGMMVVTKANLIVDSYEVLDGGAWNLYFRRRDGNGQTIYNLFQVGDFALMMTFNEDLSGGISRYFWRQVVGSGIKTETIVDEETGETSTVETDLAYITVNYGSYSSAPKEGDVVVQLGNVSVEERQGATVFGGSGANGGFFAIYQGFKSIGNSAPNLDDYNNALIYLSPKRNKLKGKFISLAGDDLQGQLDALRASMTSVAQQADRQLVIWYGDDDIPYPTSGHLDEYNQPAKDWHDADVLAGNTDQQTLHLEDIYYLRRNNTTRTGGRAWQWIYDEVLGQFLWLEITDVDVIAALEAADDAVNTANEAKEKVLNLADDGIISAGTEKSVLLTQWQDTVAEYLKLIEQAQDYDLDDDDDTNTPYNSYVSSYQTLAIMLNNGSLTNINSIYSGNAVPAWLASLNVDTELKPESSTDSTDTRPKPSEYRNTWKGYFDSRSVLYKAIEVAARLKTEAAQADATEALDKIGDMGNDGKLDPSEKLTVKREFLAAWRERDAQGGILDRCKDANGQYINATIGASYVTPYTNAFVALATYLNGSNGNWTDRTYPTTSIDDYLPLWLHSSRMNMTEDISGDTWRALWTDFYAKRTAILTALSEDAKDRADTAQATVDDLADDGIISAGTEKSSLMLEWLDVVSAYEQYVAQAIDHCDWLGTTGDEGTLRTSLGNAKNGFVGYVKALGTFLNGGTSWNYDYNAGSKPLPLYLGSDSTDGFTKDTKLSTHSQTASGYRTCWSNYYSSLNTLLRLLTKAGKLKTEKAQASADEALSAIDDIASDGMLSVTELPDLKREFESAYRQREEMADLATDDTTHKLIDVSLFSPLNTYLSAFQSLATYLNQGSSWSEPGTYSVSNGSAASATYNIVAKSQLADADFPSLMRITDNVKFQANWSSPTTAGDGGATFRNLWAECERKKVALANAMATLTKGTADEANDRIDDIVSDGIISAGSEKSLLYVDWLKAVAEYKKYIEQAEDYFGANNSQDDALVTAYTNLAKMLNNGTNPTANILNGTDRPSWLTAANMNVDTVLADTPTQTPANYHAVWNAYMTALTALLKLITKAAKDLADAAQEDATNALDKIGDMGNDGKLDPSEKITVKREFIAAYHEMMDDGTGGSASGILDMAKDSQNNWIITYATWIAPYIAAYRAIGTYLNGGTSWTEPALSSFSDNALPSWIQDDNMGNTQTIAGGTWRGLWADFYAKRTAVLTALTDKAQNTADTANNRLDDIADDGKLDPSEKITVKREFLAAWNEKDKSGGILSKCYDANNNPIINASAYITPYVNAFVALGTYLNNGIIWTAGSSVQNDIYRATDGNLPSWIQNANMDDTQTITGTAWRAKWSDFYSARTAVLTALSEAAQQTANQKKRVFQTNANELPPAPYDIGDLWMNVIWYTETVVDGDTKRTYTWNGDQLICKTARTTNASRSINDWEDAASGTNARLENLGDSIEAEVLDRKNGTSSLLKLDPTSGNLSVSTYNAATNTWSTLVSISAFLEKNGNDFTGKLSLNANNVVIDASCIDFKGKTISLTAQEGLTVSGGKLTFASGSTVDMSAATVNIGADQINFSGKNIDLSSSTVNLNSTNLTLWARFIDFTYETPVFTGANLDFTVANSLNINASQLNFNGQTVVISANQTLTFASGTMQSGQNKGRIDFTAVAINMNAEQINFKTGSFVINNGTTDTFKISSTGEVTVNGNITANSGKIGGPSGWTIAAKRISSGTFGSEESMFLATEDMSGTIAGQSSTWRFTIGSKFGVKKDGSAILSNAEITGSFSSEGGLIAMKSYGNFIGGVFSPVNSLIRLKDTATYNSGNSNTPTTIIIETYSPTHDMASVVQCSQVDGNNAILKGYGISSKNGFYYNAGGGVTDTYGHTGAVVVGGTTLTFQGGILINVS